MTVCAALLTANFTAHATDSFLTSGRSDGPSTITESKQTKIVRVPAFRGAMTFYGLAACGSWSTLGWLQERAGAPNESLGPEAFARKLAQDLTSRVTALALRPVDRLLGIHFTAYERVADYWIPEFFHVRNWNNPPYSGGINPCFVVTRETFATLKGLDDRPDEHGEPHFRKEVHDSLHAGVLYRFNNGDPVLFNPIANAILDVAKNLGNRGHVQPADAAFHLALVRRPVEVVSKLLADIASPGFRRIGGKTHDLAIAPDGTMHSTTGD